MKNLSLPIFVSCVFGLVIVPAAAAQGSVSATRVRTLTAEQEEILSHMSIVYLDDGVGGAVKTIRLTGANWQIVDGSGTTDGAPTGVGNLIVGYNELRGTGDDRTGSHNMVGGKEQSYTRFGGLVVGRRNAITGNGATVSGGRDSTASGDYSSVSGGAFNTASGSRSSISGGYGNTASSSDSSVSGGHYNTASRSFASVSGGFDNTASGYWSSVSGGYSNSASGSHFSISGGAFRSVSGSRDWAAGSLFENY